LIIARPHATYGGAGRLAGTAKLCRPVKKIRGFQ
jgi:hypothetical protein